MQTTGLKQSPGWLILSMLTLFYFLHNDLWFWDDATLILGLPVGLLYHVVYCLLASAFFAWLVKVAWPVDLESISEDGRHS